MEDGGHRTGFECVRFISSFTVDKAEIRLQDATQLNKIVFSSLIVTWPNLTRLDCFGESRQVSGDVIPLTT